MNNQKFSVKATIAQLAKRLSYPDSHTEIEENKEIVLVEANHFFSHHCSLPTIIRSLREIKDYQFIPYIPLVAWEQDNTTLQFVKSFYESMGINSEFLKANPSPKNIQDAKDIVISNLEFFKGDIWNLTNFWFDDIPIGVHLTETLLQQFKSAYLIQDIRTVSYSVGLLARYLWWKDYLAVNHVKYILASHLCYEFALPQLAGMKAGIDSYVWHESYLYHSNDFLPLPMLSDNWSIDATINFENFSPSEKNNLKNLSRIELEARTRGERVGSLRNDPRAKREKSNNESSFCLKNNRLPNIVLFCHAFSDAPCTLPRGDFGSLCSPLVSTQKIFEICKNLPLNLYVKTHPTTFGHDENALNELLEKYQNVSRLPSNFTPNELRELGVDVIITGWGNICFEAGYLGIPTLAYSSFYKVAQLAKVSIFNIEDASNFVAVLKEILSAENKTDLELEECAKGYAIVNFGGFVDLTASKLAEIPREGEMGKYAPYAYKYWSETLNEERFDNTVIALKAFLEGKGAVFSSFSIKKYFDEAIPLPDLGSV